MRTKFYFELCDICSKYRLQLKTNCNLQIQLQSIIILDMQPTQKNNDTELKQKQLFNNATDSHE